jgi:hypothetical protein
MQHANSMKRRPRVALTKWVFKCRPPISLHKQPGFTAPLGFARSLHSAHRGTDALQLHAQFLFSRIESRRFGASLSAFCNEASGCFSCPVRFFAGDYELLNPITNRFFFPTNWAGDLV